MKNSFIFLAVMLCFFPACSSQPIKPLRRGTPIVVPASAQCSFTPELRENQNCCSMKPYQTRIDVTSAFVAAVDKFRFTKELPPYEVLAASYPDFYHGHSFEKEDGLFYRLSGIVVPKNNVKLFRGIWLSLNLRKVDADLTEVRPAYCEAGARAMEDQEAWHKEVQAAVLLTLPPANTEKR